MHDEIIKKKAVALKYDQEVDNAPKVVAKGQGYLAEKIEELARQAGVPIKVDRALVEFLSVLNLYQEIPPFLYGVVAEVLAFVYQMDRRYDRR